MRRRHDEMKRSFETFHKDNPWFWALFVKYTGELIGRGFKHYSAQHGIFSRIRWEVDTADKKGRSTFKVNNNHSPFYVRLFNETYPGYADFFRIRKQTSHDNIGDGFPELGPEYFDREPTGELFDSLTHKAVIT